jgi:galactokinase
VTENGRVRSRRGAARRDLEHLGRLLRRVARLAARRLPVSVPRSRRRSRSCAASARPAPRMMGGGFGGLGPALLPPGVRAPARSIPVLPAPGRPARLTRATAS